MSLAPRLASTSARAAAPRRARRTGSPSSSTKVGSSCGLVVEPHRGAGGDARVGNLAEVVHVRPEDDGLAVDRPARARCGRRWPTRLPPTNTTVPSWYTAASSPIVSRTTMSARGSASIARSRLRRSVFQPSLRQSSVDLVEALGMARREHQQRRRRGRANPAERPQHRSLLALHRAPGDDDRPRPARCGSTAARGRGRGSGSTARANRTSATRSRSTRPGSAPSSMNRRADSSLWTQKRSMSSSTRRMNGLISR